MNVRRAPRRKGLHETDSTCRVSVRALGAARAVAVDAPVRRIHPAFRRGAHGNDDIPRQFSRRVLGSDRTYLDNRRARLFPLARAFCEARAAGRSRHARPVLAVRADVDRLQKSPARDNRRRSARARGLAAGHRRRGRCAVLLMLSRRQLRIPAAPLPQLRAVAHPHARHIPAAERRGHRPLRRRADVAADLPVFHDCAEPRILQRAGAA